MKRSLSVVPEWLADSLRVSLLSPFAVLLMTIGVCGGFLLPTLPALAACASAGLTAVFLAWRAPTSRVIALPIAACCWMLLHAHWGMQARLPAALEGDDIALTIRVVGLPEQGERQLRFEAVVEAAPASAVSLAGARLRLSSFNERIAILPGEHWQITARLKRPRGSLNPGGFDYERFALEQGIAATGYLRDAPAPELLVTSGGVDAWRLRISDGLAASTDAPAVRFLRGLAVGDRRGLSGEDWERLRATGLSHLLAISGLHIGLLAGFGALLARGLYWLCPGLGLRLPRPQAMALAALPFALGYALLAGMGLPVVRSLLMIVCVLAAVLLRRQLLPTHALALAAVVVILINPLALLGASFWLSFLGVAWLILCLPRAASSTGFFKLLLWAQIVLSLGLLPLTVWFFGQASLAGLVANLLAVPMVTLLIVPLTLLGTALLPWPALAAPVIVSAAWLMQCLWQVAGWLQSLPWAQVALAEPSVAALLLALTGVGYLLLPRGLPGKSLAALLLLPLMIPARDRLREGELRLMVIDVGQGLSVLAQTRDHTLLYDAGPAFSGGLDLGEAAVVPALRSLGVRKLDALVISHGDNDHAGGAGAVRRAFLPIVELSGEPRRAGAGLHCSERPEWRWNDVQFSLLHPPTAFPEIGNDASCVLRIGWAGGSVLLPGDINQQIETRLVRDQGQAIASDVLLVPHHGSAGSSHEAFVQAVSSRFAVISSGHGNRFGHPRAEVVERYRAHKAQIEDTAVAGAISMRLYADGEIEVEHRRDTHRRFWHEPADADSASGSSAEPAR